MARAIRQVLVLLACAALLAGLLGQLNHALSPLALGLVTPGLLIAFACLRLPPGPGLATCLLIGLWLDTAAPVGFGRHAALLGLAFCMVHRIRWRLPREETLVGVVTALFLNLALFIVLGFVDLGSLPDPAAGGLRLLVDLLVSQGVTVLIGPWFFALQKRSLELAGAEPVVVTSRFA